MRRDEESDPPIRSFYQVSKSTTTGLLAIALSSRKRLELNLTATFIDTAMTTAALVGREGEKLYKRDRGANAPFIIKNRTGYPLSLWSESSHHNGEAHRLDDGQDVPWRFDDWRAIREVSTMDLWRWSDTDAIAGNSLRMLVSRVTTP